MGGCAGKPRDLDLDEEPAPVEAPAASENTEVETVHQLQEKDGETKEEPLLDLSEPAPEAVKNEEVTPATEIKLVLEELVPVKSKPEEAEKPFKHLVAQLAVSIRASFTYAGKQLTCYR